MTDGNVTMLPAWRNAAAELFNGRFGYGDIVPHADLRAALSLPKPTGRLTAEEYESWQIALVAQVDALSAHLLEEKNMCLKAVPGQGYLIVEPAEQTGFAMKHGLKRVRHELRKMGRRLSFVDRGALTHEQARENADAMAKLSFLSQSTRKANRMKFAAEPERKAVGKD